MNTTSRQLLAAPLLARFFKRHFTSTASPSASSPSASAIGSCTPSLRHTSPTTSPLSSYDLVNTGNILRLSPLEVVSFFNSPRVNGGSAGHWRKYSRPFELMPCQGENAAERTIPPHISRPDYAHDGYHQDPRDSQHNEHTIDIKTKQGIDKMRVSCGLASYIRAYAGHIIHKYAASGALTTDDIDKHVNAECVRLGVYPSPLRYAGFTKSIATSINQVVCHGIPDQRPLQQGDIVNVDVSVFVDGMHGDCSAMFTVGEIDPLASDLILSTRACLDAAIHVCGPGVPFSRIGHTIEPLANSRGYSVVKNMCGHGIGRHFHMPPLVFHIKNKSEEIMQPGMTFTIEPMLNEGNRDVMLLSDGWTIVTRDGSRSAQWEETILITETGYEILTQH